jgi:NAD(P)-dependent dehydrogenase (short-subunit alcohol dehydrogenase family)
MTGQGGMAGKVCVVTGASSGIGLETALALAERGARIVLVCRSRQRGEEALRQVRARAGRDDARLVIADLASQAEIRRAAGEILAAEPRLDVLVNNAGIVNLAREVTVDGIEAVFAVNHLAYFLLTNLLLDRLRESGHARIVNVSSNAHKFGRFDLEDLQFERRKFGWGAAYGQSKLCNLLFTRELAKRLAGSGVTVNAVHPGAVATRLAQNNGWFARTLTTLIGPLIRSAAKGAETSVYLASSPEVERVSGRYFSDCREIPTSAAAQDDATAARLWELSARLTELRA